MAAQITGTVETMARGVSLKVGGDPALPIRGLDSLFRRHPTIAEVEKNAGYTIQGVRPGRYRIMAESARLNGLHPDRQTPAVTRRRRHGQHHRDRGRTAAGGRTSQVIAVIAALLATA